MNLFFVILFLLFLTLANCPISTAKELYDNDHLLLAFVRDQPNFEQFCKGFNDKHNEFSHLTKKYEANLGVVYLMRENWHCAKNGDKISENEQKECHKYRKYLDIVYEYLFRVYARFPAVKPMFYLGNFFSFCSLTDTTKSLALIWKFYSDSAFGDRDWHAYQKMFVRNSKLMLFNEDKLSYGANLDNSTWTFHDIIVRIGVEFKWDKRIRESYVELMQHKFDKFLWAMLKKAEKDAIRKDTIESSEKEEEQESRVSSTKSMQNLKKYDKVLLHWRFRLGGHYTLDEASFIAFVRGRDKFEQFCNQLEKVGRLESICEIRADTFVKNKENLAGHYAINYLGNLFLMRLNWHCAEIADQSEVEEKMECEKFRKYLDIMYEYLFKIYAKAKVPELAKQMPAVKPIFQGCMGGFLLELKITVHHLHRIADIFKNKTRKKATGQFCSMELRLLNENEMRNYEANFGTLSETLRQKFDNELKTMLKKARKRKTF